MAQAAADAAYDEALLAGAAKAAPKAWAAKAKAYAKAKVAMPPGYDIVQ